MPQWRIVLSGKFNDDHKPFRVFGGVLHGTKGFTPTRSAKQVLSDMNPAYCGVGTTLKMRRTSASGTSIYLVGVFNGILHQLVVWDAPVSCRVASLAYNISVCRLQWLSKVPIISGSGRPRALDDTEQEPIVTEISFLNLPGFSTGHPATLGDHVTGRNSRCYPG